MRLTRPLLESAVTQGLLHPHQADNLWQFLVVQSQNQPGFRLAHILYYLGGLIAIGAMTLFMTLGWERFGGWGLCATAVGYAAIALFLTHHFLRTRHLPIPAGIMATLTVALTPLAIYGLQQATGWWTGRVYTHYHQYIDGSWLLMELGTLASAAILLWWYRLPFMVMPVAVTLWYMSMDLTPFIFGVEDLDWELRKLMSMWSGELIILLGFWIDTRSKGIRDYAFWLYLFGTLAFWGALSFTYSNSELDKFLYLCINLAMILFGAIISRRVFVIFGALGVAGYLGHLAYDVFRESVFFPFALSAIGLVVIGLGLVWQRHELHVQTRLRKILPRAWQTFLEHRGN